MSATDLFAQARAWAADDPDPADRAELEGVLATDTQSARRDLADRLSGRLRFGTAGLRGPVGAGPNRMNRAVVRATTAALAHWLRTHRASDLPGGVVVGCDARHRSTQFADEATAVLTGAGIPVHRLPDRRPTPLLAFSVRHLGAAAGIMITASHNPPADNGYKLYLGDGAQIVPPVDAEIEALIDEVGPLSSIPLGATDGPLVVRHGAEVTDAYLDAVLAETPAATPPPGPLKVVYTPMHGVAGSLFCTAMDRAGLPPPFVVGAQAAPDPDFPTVAFPNPEEPGALDLALASARTAGADLVLAHDPDGDRLAVAVPDGSAAGGWRRLTGDEVGALLGSFVIERTGAPGRPVVAASIVSSTLLAKVAAQAGVAFVATLTGFKWIVRAPEAVPGGRFAFGYEEALGYAVGDAVRDKDGIGAALAVLALAGHLQAQGSSLLLRLDDLSRRYGVHQTAQRSVASGDPERLMVRLRRTPPTEIARSRVERTVDLETVVAWQEGLPPLPSADVLAFFLSSGARVLVRPSGTEPKVKCYLEVVEPVGAGHLRAARARASEEIERLLAAAGPLLST